VPSIPLPPKPQISGQTIGGKATISQKHATDPSTHHYENLPLRPSTITATANINKQDGAQGQQGDQTGATGHAVSSYQGHHATRPNTLVPQAYQATGHYKTDQNNHLVAASVGTTLAAGTATGEFHFHGRKQFSTAVKARRNTYGSYRSLPWGTSREL
jgi:hypothetical protein